MPFFFLQFAESLEITWLGRISLKQIILLELKERTTYISQNLHKLSKLELNKLFKVNIAELVI